MNISDPDSDIELFAQIAADDHQAFARLLARHSANLFGQAMAYLKDSVKAQDVVQEVFLDIWKKRKRLREVVEPENYLFIMARNKIVSEFRKKMLQPLSGNQEEEQPDTGILPSNLLENRQLLNEIHTIVNRMPAQRRKVFELCKFEGLKHDEIASLLGISKNTVKVHMVQALSHIRSFLRDQHITILPALAFIQNFF